MKISTMEAELFNADGRLKTMYIRRTDNTLQCAIARGLRKIFPPEVSLSKTSCLYSPANILVTFLVHFPLYFLFALPFLCFQGLVKKNFANSGGGLFR